MPRPHCPRPCQRRLHPRSRLPRTPRHPLQRALIVHRDNTETLIVESAFQTPSPDVAWILPLPSAPSNLHLADPGILTSASASLRPNITHDLHDLWLIPTFVLLIILLFTIVRLTNPDRTRRHSRYTTYFAVVTLFIIFLSLLLPTLGTAGGTSALDATPGISIQSAQRLGNYDLTVLTAADPTALSNWLTDQSLQPLPPAAQTLVADYIARHWCFLVTHLHPGSPDLSAPQPLSVTFPASSPVFPMKLTALANTTTHVELIIIANQQASAPNFHCQTADRFQPVTGQPENYYHMSISDSYHAPDTKLTIGSPDIVPLLWPNAVVTKLTADLAPSAMSSDIIPAFHPLCSHRDHFFTSLSARQIALTALIILLILWTLILAFLAGAGRKTSPGERRFLTRSALAVPLLALLTWLSLPTIPVHTVPHRLRYITRFAQPYLMTAVMAADENLISPDMNPAQLAALPQLMVDRHLITSDVTLNPFTGTTMRSEHSPGNFSVRTIYGKPCFCLYNEDSLEQFVPLPLPPTTQPSPP